MNRWVIPIIGILVILTLGVIAAGLAYMTQPGAPNTAIPRPANTAAPTLAPTEATPTLTPTDTPTATLTPRPANTLATTVAPATLVPQEPTRVPPIRRLSVDEEEEVFSPLSAPSTTPTPVATQQISSPIPGTGGEPTATPVYFG